jgi:spermidine/putrescine transport system substrate-binding protein
MRLLKILLISAAMVWAAGPSAALAAGEVHVLNWQGYGTDEPWGLEAFEAKTGYKVVHDAFNSEQEMLTKLRTSPGAYDVVLINSAFTGQAAEEGLIQPIDPAKIGNFADLDPALRDAAAFKRDGKLYGVAWTWGVTSIGYNSDKIGDPGRSIGILWDAAHKDKISLRDDAVEAVAIAALATGQDINDPADLDAVREKLRALKPQLAVYWSGSAARSKKAFGLPVGFLIPNEGAIAWLDGLSLAADAPNPDGGLKFIDFMVSPEHYVRWDTEVGAPASANSAAMRQLPTDAFNRTVLGDPEATKNLQFMAPLPDERREAFLEIWQETKAYYAE